MSKSTLVAALSAASLAATAGIGHAGIAHSYSGQECQAITPYDATRTGHGQRGCTNTGGPDGASCSDRSRPVNVVLPIDGSEHLYVDFDNVSVFYDDNSPDQITCQIVVYGQGGSIYYSHSRSSLSQQESFMTWTGASLPNGGELTLGLNQYLQCTIPSRYYRDNQECRDEGHSYIVGYHTEMGRP